jgi:hypothetical protein
MAKLQFEPALKRVTYSPKRDVIRLLLEGERLVEIPRHDVEELRDLDERELTALHSDNAGMTLSQRSLDIDIYVPGLLAAVLGLNPGSMLGKVGGAKRSPAKRRASRENGQKGGRPRKRRKLIAA